MCTLTGAVQLNKMRCQGTDPVAGDAAGFWNQKAMVVDRGIAEPSDP